MRRTSVAAIGVLATGAIVACGDSGSGGSDVQAGTPGSGAGAAAASASGAGGCSGAGPSGVLEPLDGSLPASSLVVRGRYVYYATPDPIDGYVARVPFGGGAHETIVESPVSTFDVNDAGVMAWVESTPSSTADTSPPTIVAPVGTTSVADVAVDGAGNVLFRGQEAAGTVIVRWSTVRRTADILLTDYGFVGRFFHDGDGIAWVASTDSGRMLWHEDANGGIPTSGPKVSIDATVVGLDTYDLYATTRTTGEIEVITRASGDTHTLLTTPGKTAVGAVGVDDTNVYFVSSASQTGAGASGASSISRAAKGTGQIESFADANGLTLLAVDGCSVVWVGKTGDGTSWGIVAKAK
jgi:hypothetical protein